MSERDRGAAPIIHAFHSLLFFNTREACLLGTQRRKGASPDGRTPAHSRAHQELERRTEERLSQLLRLLSALVPESVARR